MGFMADFLAESHVAASDFLEWEERDTASPSGRMRRFPADGSVRRPAGRAGKGSGGKSYNRTRSLGARQKTGARRMHADRGFPARPRAGRVHSAAFAPRIPLVFSTPGAPP
jgi:hypothetical protein